MSSREPWLGVASVLGLVVMLLADGMLDGLGLSLALAPLAYAGIAVWKARSRR